MLQKLLENNSLNQTNFAALNNGYRFLSQLDHALRLSVGRSNTLPNNLNSIAKRLKTDTLLEQLTLHRIAIRQAFEQILS